MLPNDRNKQTLLILSKLKERGMPPASPFPGEQGATVAGQDLSPQGDVTGAIDPELAGLQPGIKKKKPPLIGQPPEKGPDVNSPVTQPGITTGAY